MTTSLSVPALNRPSLYRSLSAQGNHLYDEGVKHLAEALKKNSMVQTLEYAATQPAPYCLTFRVGGGPMCVPGPTGTALEVVQTHLMSYFSFAGSRQCATLDHHPAITYALSVQK